MAKKTAQSSGKAVKFILTNLRKNIKFLIKLYSFLTGIKKKNSFLYKRY